MSKDIEKYDLLLPKVPYSVNLISLEVSSGVRKGASPLSALFPKVGSTESIVGIRKKIEERLNEIDEFAGGEKSTEESMLRQVLQWLTQGMEE